MDSSSSGRRRAACRVKQNMRNEQRRWSPSGKAALRRSHRIDRIQIQRKPWSDRFIFDEESLAKKSIGDLAPVKGNAGKCLSRASMHPYQRIRNGNNDNKNSGCAASQENCQRRSVVKTLTERADGEAVVTFSRREIHPSSPLVSDLTTTCSTGVSPFDLAKLQAALDTANSCSCQEEALHQNDDSEQCGHNQNKANKGNSKISLRTDNQFFLRCDNTLMPPDKESLVRIFEDLLYTTELEEALLSANLMEHDAHDIAPTQTVQKIPCGSTIEKLVDFVDGNIELVQPISKEHVDGVTAYVRANKNFRYQREKALTKHGCLKYHEIVQILSESILDSCIHDIVEELHDAIHLVSEDTFQHL